MIKCIKYNFKRYKISKETARLYGLNAEIQNPSNIVHVNCTVKAPKMQSKRRQGNF
jgi:hypothetical protein